ncbi:MAG: superoxide dismutase [Candidatus Methanomethylicia archaeon]
MYKPKNYEQLIGIKGFSEQLLRNHFTLYQGYVNNTNKLLEVMKNLIMEGKIGTPEYAEVKRRFGWEFNGMKLHEYYFENMTKEFKEIDKNSKMYLKIVEDFGSYENWEKEFKGIGAMRGIGWVILYYDKSANKLLNVWINEHDVGHLAGLTPILVMDVFEHAYMIDYGLRKIDYIEAFFKSINWIEVNRRFEEAIK